MYSSGVKVHNTFSLFSILILQKDHCGPGVDFREIVSSDAWEVKRNSYLSKYIPTSMLPNLSEGD